MSFSRSSPSPRYIELQAMYRQMHQKGEEFLGVPAEKTFPGFSLDAQLSRIKALITRTGADTLLDYGCGKGQQYLPRPIKDESGTIWPAVIDYLDIGELVCYDPCYEPHNILPEGKFDGVISTDVLEHCIEEDIPWIVAEMFAYANRFVFAAIACYPAKTTLPNGENAHATVRPIDWWKQVFTDAGNKHPEVMWKLFVEEH